MTIGTKYENYTNIKGVFGTYDHQPTTMFPLRSTLQIRLHPPKHSNRTNRKCRQQAPPLPKTLEESSNAKLRWHRGQGKQW